MTTTRKITLFVWLVFAASEFTPSSIAHEPPDAELLAHGVRQVENMIKDRPLMGAYHTDTGVKLVRQTDPFYEWAVRKFAGEDTKTPVFWDASKPATEAEHSPPNEENVGLIRVSRTINLDHVGAWKGKEKAFELLWSHAIFELNNVSGFAVFLKIHDRALNGTIEREAYIMAMAKNEHAAYLKTNKFFKEVWVPWAIEVQLKPTTQRFMVSWDTRSESFDDWISKYTDRNNYPWIPFGTSFDEADQYRKKYGAPPRNPMPSADYWKALRDRDDARRP